MDEGSVLGELVFGGKVDFKRCQDFISHLTLTTNSLWAVDR